MMSILPLLAAALSALSPAEVLFYRLGVPVGSRQMVRLQRNIDNMWKDSAVFEDAALLDRRVATLENTLGANAARVVVLRSPRVLALDLDASLSPRIGELQALLPGIDVPRLLARAPALLEIDFASRIEPRVRQIEAMLPAGGEGVVRTVRRMPSLLHLSDLDERLDAIAALLPGVDMRQVVSRAPSVLAYTPEALSRKLADIAELFDTTDALAMVKREPALLTYNVRATLANKVSVYEAELPGIDVRRLLAGTPRLLSYDVAKTLPRKLESLRATLPGADVPRLVKSVPQLLEFDIESSLPAKLTALRALFHPSAVAPPPPPPNAAQRLAASKLLAARGGVGSGGRARTSASKAASVRSALAADTARRGRAGAREMTTVGLLRLAALDVSVVEKRLGRLSTLLPEVDTINLVCKQPSLLRRDVDGSLRPRLLFLTDAIGEAAEATRVVVGNPRLLLSSWGVLSRLAFVRQHVVGGFATVSVSTTIMTPKAEFGERFPRYRLWLRTQLEASQLSAAHETTAKAVPRATASVSTLENQLAAILESRVGAGSSVTMRDFERSDFTRL